MTSLMSVIGIDVAKDSLSLFQTDSGQATEIANDTRSIKAWLKSVPAHSAIAIEATGIYHMEVATLAYAAQGVGSLQWSTKADQARRP